MALPALEIETAAKPRHAVIWLHGLGADGHDFEPIVPELIGQDWPAVRFVFPHAPQQAVTINSGAFMRAWYDIRHMDLSVEEDEAGIRASWRLLYELIDREIERGVPAEHIVLAGFSQGGAIVLSGGLRFHQALGGVVALSTYLPLPALVRVEKNTANAKLPIFMGHGSHDPIIPERLAIRSRDDLVQQDYAVHWRTYPMAHQVCREEIMDLRAWMSARFNVAVV